MTAYFPPTIGLNELNVALPWVLAALALMQAKLTRNGNAEAASRIYAVTLLITGGWRGTHRPQNAGRKVRCWGRMHWCCNDCAGPKPAKDAK